MALREVENMQVVAHACAITIELDSQRQQLAEDSFSFRGNVGAEPLRRSDAVYERVVGGKEG